MSKSSQKINKPRNCNFINLWSPQKYGQRPWALSKGQLTDAHIEFINKIFLSNYIIRILVLKSMIKKAASTAKEKLILQIKNRYICQINGSFCYINYQDLVTKFKRKVAIILFFGCLNPRSTYESVSKTVKFWMIFFWMIVFDSRKIIF